MQKITFPLRVEMQGDEVYLVPTVSLGMYAEVHKTIIK